MVFRKKKFPRFRPRKRGITKGEENCLVQAGLRGDHLKAAFRLALDEHRARAVDDELHAWLDDVIVDVARLGDPQAAFDAQDGGEALIAFQFEQVAVGEISSRRCGIC